MTPDQPDRVKLVFNTFAERLECSARLFKADEMVSLEPDGETMLTVPVKYVTDDQHGSILKDYQPMLMQSPLYQQDSEDEVVIDLDEMKDRCAKEIERLTLG